VQIKAWVKARRKALRFQNLLAKPHRYKASRRAALRRSHLSRHELGKREICKAPLTPD